MRRARDKAANLPPIPPNPVRVWLDSMPQQLEEYDGVLILEAMLRHLPVHRVLRSLAQICQIQEARAPGHLRAGWALAADVIFSAGCQRLVDHTALWLPPKGPPLMEVIARTRRTRGGK